jgi:hypothetical protein
MAGSTKTRDLVITMDMNKGIVSNGMKDPPRLLFACFPNRRIVCLFVQPLRQEVGEPTKVEIHLPVP